MKGAGVDSLSRWGEFEVRRDVFQSMQRSSRSRWGKAAGAAGYTADLDRYASPPAKQCTRYCARGAEAALAGGEPGCLGDTGLVKLSDEDNVWAGPAHHWQWFRPQSAASWRCECEARSWCLQLSGKLRLGTSSCGRGLPTLCRCHGAGRCPRWWTLHQGVATPMG